jgi:phosphate uptake regulator
MELRRVQMTGGSSYVITLPKDWVESLLIKKNDPLGVIVQADGNLLITKNISGDHVQRIKTIDVDQNTDAAYFLRLLIGTYIAGFSEIKVQSRDRLPGQIRMKMREFTNMVIGPEFVEETDHSVILKDLLNPLEMPFENSLKRMFVIVKGMHSDAIEAMLKHEKDLADDVVERDNDVDRLFWLIGRQTNMIMHNVHLSRKMNTTVSRMLPHYQVARIIERVGDHAVRIAGNTQKLMEVALDPAIMEHIKNASAEAVQIFERSVESFFTHDLKKANRMIESIGKLENNYLTINEEIMHLKTPVAMPIRNTIDSIRRTGEYSADIAENVINNEMMLDESK